MFSTVYYENNMGFTDVFVRVPLQQESLDDFLLLRFVQVPAILQRLANLTVITKEENITGLFTHRGESERENKAAVEIKCSKKCQGLLLLLPQRENLFYGCMYFWIHFYTVKANIKVNFLTAYSISKDPKRKSDRFCSM